MTANRRIILNIVATYGRSLFGLVCGLFTARWVLMALGEVDYGLYGLVGGLTLFVSFFNNQLAMAVGRFYAYAVGEAKRPGNAENGLEECRKWFTTAVLIHSVVPVVLLIVGYPIGIWAVENFLTIPADRLAPCIWVWRCVCLSCFIGMVNVPYQAMYTAKQEIAELTIYDFCRTTLNVVVFYYMVSHPGDWLVKYAVWMMLASIVPQLIICFRAFVVYPECRIRRCYLFLPRYIRDVATFSGWRLLNGLAMTCSSQGNAILVNKYLGPSFNATMSIASTLASQSSTLAGSFSGAFYPAITNAAGERDMAKMQSMTFRACKFGTLAVLIFTLPLLCECEEVLRLWLKNPPAQCALICSFILVCEVLEKITDGHWMAIFAIGKIGAYQITASISGFAVLAIAFAFLSCGWGICGVGWAMICGKIISQFVRLYYGHREAKLSIRHWLGRIACPIAVVSMISLLAGWLVVGNASPSFLRIVLTTILIEVVFLPLSWYVVLDRGEKQYVISNFCRIKEKIFH